MSDPTTHHQGGTQITSETIQAAGKEIRTFEDLDCWKACRDLRIFISKQILPVLPGDDKRRLGDQVLRAARSTTANIAEGYGRYHYLDNAKFCSNARGSCYEVLDHLLTGNDEGIISDELLKRGRAYVGTALRLLNGYMTYLKRTGNRKVSSVVRPEDPITHNQ